VRISVRLFAGLRERAGSDRVEVELPDGASVADLLAAMASTPVGALAPRSCIVALNREYAPADAVVGAGDEVALVPPVSGGAQDVVRSPVSGGAEEAVRLVAVTGDALDLALVAAAVRDPRAGAVVCFEGVTRAVEALDYEAYAEMAQEKLRAIGEQEAARHGLSAVALVHRTGRVPLSEPSVIVAASAPHRGDAFAGARALIDRVKAEAPIWKVELTPAGARRVEGTLPKA
jgi:molybdopterin converting factor subunit 1